jgi:sphingolipid delta-4 desaturase
LNEWLPNTNSIQKAGKEMPQDPNDFLWMLTEEPHRSRRKAILKAHPEVRKLMGYTRWTLPCVILVLGIQLGTAYTLRHTHPLSWKFLLVAYIIGGTANQNIFLAIHEITHNLAFKRILPNKILAMVANIAIGVPYAMAFKGYHIEHHKFLGEDGIDTDLPSKVEAVVLNNVAGKTFFA